MGRVIDANSDRSRFVRSVTLLLAKRDENDKSHRRLDRPVNKLVLLLKSEEID